MPKLSSITITANEAANAADGIDSVNFYDERMWSTVAARTIRLPC